MRLLFLTHRVPFAPNRGDRIRAFHMLRYFKAQRISVCLVALAHDDTEMAEAVRLTDLVDAIHVIRVTPARNLVRAGLQIAIDRPLTHVLLDSPKMRPVLDHVCRVWQPDIALAYCSGMARFAMEPPLDTLPFVLDMVDVDSEKWRALAGKAPRFLRAVYRREARLLEAFEARAAHAARCTLVVNERERASMARIAPRATVTVVPNGIDLEFFRPTGSTPRRQEVVFVGVFDYAPNAAGAAWLLRDVWPRVLARRPDATLAFVGSGPSRAIRDAARASQSITVTGAVPDVRPFLWRATVSAAPLLVARGLQNKVLEALAAGLNVVTTTVVAAGLPAPLAACCRVADDAPLFAEALVESLDKGVPSGLDAQLTPFLWNASLAGLAPLLAGHDDAGDGGPAAS